MGPGVVAIDGTRIAGNASPEANVEFAEIAREILAEARASDEAEDELYGEARGDELPEQLRTVDGRREFLRHAREERRADKEAQLAEETEVDTEEVSLEFEAERIVARTQGREGWVREAKRQAETYRWQHPDAIVRSRSERLAWAAERLALDLEVERRANETYERFREN